MHPSHTPDASVMEKTDHHALRMRLRYNVLLETISDEEFSSLLPAFCFREYVPGDVIIGEGTQGSEVFFLVEGRIRIARPSRSGEEHLIGLLHAGDCFGEMESLAGRPRSARVTAEDLCRVFTLPRERFELLLRDSPECAGRLLQILSVRMRALNDHFVSEMNRRVDRSAHELAKLEKLIEATRRLNSTLDLNELLDIILDLALQIVNADRGTVYLLDEKKGELWTKIARGLDLSSKSILRLPLGKGIAGYVAATGDTINIPDAYLDPRFSPEFDQKTGYRTQSILCMPMVTKDKKRVGVFQLLNKHTGPFSDEDAQIIDALSVHAALAIENARLYAQEREKIRIERDLHAAREVQVRLLPSHLPVVPGYDFATAFIPARDVGGDLYNFIRLEENRLAFCVGDVSGKGLPAALLMAHFQATLQDVAHETSSTSACTRRVNQHLHHTAGEGKFVTLFYAMLDPENHTLTYCNGGHNPPLLVSPDGEIRMLSVGGTVLGIMDDFPFDEETITISSGDVLVLYSDGITEAPDTDGELFGDQQLADVVRQHRHERATVIKDSILEAVRTHAGDGAAADDITLVIVKRVAVQ
jgi:phosphoserine phosphatase RsbU/P